MAGDGVVITRVDGSLAAGEINLGETGSELLPVSAERARSARAEE